MNRTSFTCVVLTVFTLGATEAEAVPIRYEVDWAVGTIAFGDPVGLRGANIHFEAQWDPATLTPTVGLAGVETNWPNLSEISQVTVTGSQNADGTYLGYSGGYGWDFSNDVTRVDSPQDVISHFFGFEATIGGYRLTFLPELSLFLPASFNTPAPDGTIYPYPFENSDLVAASSPQIWIEAGESGDDVSYSVGQLISARAEIVPEPAAMTLMGIGAIALMGWQLRMRRRRNPQ